VITVCRSAIGAVGTLRNATDLRIPVVDSVLSDPLERTHGWDMPEALVPLVVLLAILAMALWVYSDARRWAVRGGAVARIGSFAVEKPETWFLSG